MVIAILYIALDTLDMLTTTAVLVLLFFHYLSSPVSLPIAKELTSAIISLPDLPANIP